MKVEGVIEVAGKIFNMPYDEGYGLIYLYDKWTLIEFSCPFETCPPKGSGDIISHTFSIDIVKGRLTYNGRSVFIGEEAM